MEELNMYQPETPTERGARLARLVANLIRRVEAGGDIDQLRENLKVAIMMSPITSDESAKLLKKFDDTVRQAR